MGLGNPGSTYEKTRHNIGFRVVEQFAAQRGWPLKKEPDLNGQVASGEGIIVFRPLTFMNRSGEAVKRCIERFQVPLDHLLVVSDDVALPLGVLRLRSKGSAGGHNGLKSIEAHLGTSFYSRLKLGVGSPAGEVLADYVLGPFSLEEEKVAQESIERATVVLELFVKEGLSRAMQQANARKCKKGEENGKTEDTSI